MRITDEDWLKTFGTDSSQLEPKVKLKPGSLPRHQYEAQLILDRPDLFGFGWQPEATETPQQTVSVAMAATAEHVTKAARKTLFDDQDTTAKIAEQPQRAQGDDAVLT